jgi:glycosyltransferase involved in cell wall biosynthesis
MPMKICMIAPEFPPVWGGVGTYIFELVRHIPKNIDMHILTPSREGFNKQQLANLNTNVLQYLGSNIHLHYISRAKDSFFYNAQFQYACMREVPKIVKEQKIDVIHSHAAHMPDLLLMFRRLKTPIVTTIHTTIKSQRIGTKASKGNLSDLESSEKATQFLYPALRLTEELYFRQKRLYITPSNWMKNWFTQNFKVKTNIRVVPNCIDINDYVIDENDLSTQNIIPPHLKEKRIILFAGRLLSLKGVDVLVRAVPKISKSITNDDILFVFAGPGDSSRFRNKLIETNTQAKCLFTGPLPKENVVKLMSKSELVILPTYNDNSPYTILEAMACGTPVVASNVGGIPEIITNGYDGILVKPGSPEILANAIIDILQNKTLHQQISKRAKETIAKKFSWETNLPKYLNTYYDAINNN